MILLIMLILGNNGNGSYNIQLCQESRLSTLLTFLLHFEKTCACVSNRGSVNNVDFVGRRSAQNRGGVDNADGGLCWDGYIHVYTALSTGPSGIIVNIPKFSCCRHFFKIRLTLFLVTISQAYCFLSQKSLKQGSC